MKKYILKDGIAVEEPDLMKWVRWFETADRVVEQTQIGPVTVSTVFLGMDHGYSILDDDDPDNGLPILYETMVFGGQYTDHQTRAATVEEAKLNHEEAVKLHLRCL